MSDDGIGLVLIFLHEIGDTGERYLVDILVDLVGCHTDTAVADCQRAGFLVEAHVDGEVAGIALEIALADERFQLLCGVDGIADHLAEEDLVVRVKEFLDDREDILCRYTYITLLHIFDFNYLYSAGVYAKNMPNGTDPGTVSVFWHNPWP